MSIVCLRYALQLSAFSADRPSTSPPLAKKAVVDVSAFASRRPKTAPSIGRSESEKAYTKFWSPSPAERRHSSPGRLARDQKCLRPSVDQVSSSRERIRRLPPAQEEKVTHARQCISCDSLAAVQPRTDLSDQTLPAGDWEFDRTDSSDQKVPALFLTKVLPKNDMLSYFREVVDVQGLQTETWKTWDRIAEANFVAFYGETASMETMKQQAIAMLLLKLRLYLQGVTANGRASKIRQAIQIVEEAKQWKHLHDSSLDRVLLTAQRVVAGLTSEKKLKKKKKPEVMSGWD
mmetsp:Transcript_22790/g.37509  ORF Transcript_22790/g.37509 Transcript_22790/m.37509 type:complete len:290 (-) Transcript_22790:313-1182(-)|eukprot:CAMPEP_0184653820 /NCGR_PEP_ID=MMETSP0308-20130426/11529_1 /TAXON_ID=38269 /ORGANISM="Gloeochaete witrockiana, Strain SAG 46.84" /LENGTH=289 /DNA_ID=CAMNT_0027089473 /DNA_START=31 /DNA_END=900 /DNA_ORIENTATION=+